MNPHDSEDRFSLFVETGEVDLKEGEFSAAQAGKRLDTAIHELFPEISRTRAQSLIEEGAVMVNGGIAVLKKKVVHEGDEIEIRLGRRVPVHVLPEPIDFEILYEDAELIVVNKPKGLVVHPAPGNETGTLVNGLLAHMAAHDNGLSSIGGTIRPGIVHRIDKNTSGLLVVAKTDRAHSALADQLSRHEMTRVYLALVSGGFKVDKGMVDAPLGRDPKDRKRQKVMIDGSGRRAVTHYEVLERFADTASLLRLRLETGRTHQIRAHMAHIGHPVLGDDVYGTAKDLRKIAAHGHAAENPNGVSGEVSGQYLHAAVLGFIHPVTGEYMEFETPPPEDFTALVEALRR
ncbi:MAG: RluA family pseudouridine synthase [Clostridiales Family XIII bacterium]|jgi:23S rRNA pseudouridine1911/1915/1917 synthase|nr:RluA family pseudouridine synthase [Clostridiales Family XIII bacterium]